MARYENSVPFLVDKSIREWYNTPMNETKAISEDVICDQMTEGQAFVRSCNTPFIINAAGRPVRYFETDDNLDLIEYDGEGEEIVKFDLNDFHTRYGDFSDVYDINELSYWEDNGTYRKGEHFEDQIQIVKLDKSKK